MAIVFWFELFKMECMYGDSLNEEDEVQVFNEDKGSIESNFFGYLFAKRGTTTSRPPVKIDV